MDYQKEIARLIKALKKLDRPPAAQNWVRFIFDDVAKTAKAMVRFAKGQPPFNYLPGYRAVRDRIELRISLEAAVKVATAKGSPAGRWTNREFVEAFFKYDEVRQYSASNPVGFDIEFFRASREVLIPVAPLSVIREKGQFVPIFACGWSSNPLILHQRRLLMTLYDDAFLSLTDYQSSPAEVLFFPKNDDGETRERESEVWMRGDYELLPKRELDECLEVFMLARSMARQILVNEIEELKRKSAEGQDSAKPEQPDGGLFPPK
jgi:hypothetical protein